MLINSPTLERIVEEVGLAARWEARGEAQGEARAKVQFAKKLIQKGWDSVEIAEITGLDLPTVQSLAETAHT